MKNLIYYPLRIARWIKEDSSIDIPIPNGILTITGPVGIIAACILMLGIVGWMES